MKKAGLAFLSMAVAATDMTALARQPSPVPSITNATLEHYRDQYQQSPLCRRDELTLWSCETGKQVFSLCSSQTATRTKGYIQYRSSKEGKLRFVFPAAKVHPSGLFKCTSFGNGNASVEFDNNGYRYSLEDPLRGPSTILVSAPGPSGKTTEIACGPNQTLQLNYSMRLMHDFGLWTGD